MRLFRNLILAASFFLSPLYAQSELISLFPLNNYDQSIEAWLKPQTPSYDSPLLDSDVQRQRFDVFYAHYFGALSPWDAVYIQQIINQVAPNNIKAIEQSIIAHFTNENKSDDQIGYGENFRPYTKNWIDTITQNINLPLLDHLHYNANNRAIAIDNLVSRLLPTEEAHFYSYKLAGQGFPFDNLQNSSVWAGTPLYVLTESDDHAWSLVLTPDLIAWVKSNGIVRVNATFIRVWKASAKNKLAAITKTNSSIVDRDGHYLFSAYIGSVFPMIANNKIWIPAADENRNAVIKTVSIAPDSAVAMPFLATPHHFAILIKNLIGRPYGWGNLYFYNDCSAEIKSLFTPFAIWLPRHSSDQVKEGRMVDMSAASPEQRLNYLMQNGKPLLTSIYIGGHVVLYVGNYPNPLDHTLMAMTYQNIWGLRPKTENARAVIGQAVLFPLLLQYPEDSRLASLASKAYFQVAYYDKVPILDLVKSIKTIDLRALMFPEN